MSDVADEVKFSLTLMINKEKTKVLFASVDNAFVDVLLSFLTLPLGGIEMLLHNNYGGDKAPTIGSLKTLYNGLQNLDSTYFRTKAGKEMLLSPRSSHGDECRKLILNVYESPPTKYFTCGCSLYRVSLYYAGGICTNCKKLMNNQVISMRRSNGDSVAGDSEVFTRQAVHFIISDNLQMLPSVSGSIIKNLRNWGIMDLHGAELKIVTVGLNEIVDLLKVSLFSSSPLTDLFLHNGKIHHAASAESDPLSLLPEEVKSSFKDMKIKVLMQKSTKKFLFAEAGEGFVEFLFSFLTIPLGQVECLLSMNAGLGSIDTLYKSFANIDHVKCLKAYFGKDSLLKPKLPPKYLSNKHILPLQEQATPCIYYNHAKNITSNTHSYWSTIPEMYSTHQHYAATVVDPKSNGSYLKDSGMFMVTDDLTVTPLFMISSLTNLIGLEVPFTDIEEHEINVGLEEAISILKASLVSTSALSNGLKLNDILVKQPKQEVNVSGD